MENEELIRRNMEKTRESLTAKLETLEHKLADSVEVATSAVNTVKETVQDSVESVKETVHDSVESVKDFMDVKTHVDHHPWLMLGGAIVTGYVVGTMLSGGEKESRQSRDTAPAPSKGQHGTGNGRHKHREKEPPAESTNWLSAFEPELKKLKNLALGVAIGTAREIVATEVPPKMAEMVRSILDGVTKKVGGEPMPPSDWATKPSEPAAESKEPQPAGSNGGSATRFGELDPEKPRW